MAELVVSGLVKRFAADGGVTAVDGIDISVADGEMLVLLGPSGCGKSTVLRCLAGLEAPDEGKIQIGGAVVFDAAKKIFAPAHKRDIGMVFQSYALWPHLSVYENVAYPLKARRVGGDIRARVMAALSMVRCEALGKRLPSELSGGQQQRVALARALVARPRVLLLDEPLSNLDALLRQELRAELHRLHEEVQFTAIYVTHDHVEAFNLANRIAVIRAGRIEQLGSPHDVYDKPQTPYVAKFLGIRNDFCFERRDDGWAVERGARVTGPVSRLAGVTGTSRYRVFLRPEHMLMSPAKPPNAAAAVSLGEGSIADVLYSGGRTEYVVDIQGQPVFARSDGETSMRRGTRVWVSFLPERALVYPEAVLNA
jgi:iron(III) transport system ATP-binding protein